MNDDATAGRWEPPADQPVLPEPPQQQPPPPEPSWAAPAYGPPPSSEPGGAATPPNAFSVPPPSAGFVYPEGAQNPYGPYRVDYLESPARRRSPALLIAAGLVVLAVVGAGVGLISSRSSHSTSGVAVAPSASAQPQTQPPASTPSGQPPSGGDGEPGAGSGPLDGYLLPPSLVGAGTLMALIPGGRSVTDQATLDFCNSNYTSESLRATRVQVQYVGGDGQTASNEFVRYRAVGATAAFGELQKAIASCPSSYHESGGEVSDIHRLSGLSGLAKDSAAVSFTSTFTGIGGVVHQATTVVYQFDGDYFSGVYVYGTDAATVQAAAAKLGAASAKLLAEAAAGKPGTGGGPLANPQASAPGVQT